mgnify:FL=1
MKAMVQGRLLEIVVGNARAATVALRSRLGADRVSQFGDRVHVHSDATVAQASAEIRDVLAGVGVQVLRIEETTFSLEDVFIDVVNRSRETVVAQSR